MRYWVLFLIIMLAIGDLFAQEHWVPKSISIQVPLMVHDHYFNTIPGQVYDRSSDGKMLLGIGISSTDSLMLSSRRSDTIMFIYGQKALMGSENRIITLSFILDSIEKKIKNFYISYDFDTSFASLFYPTIVHDHAFMRFNSFDYNQPSDSNLIVAASADLSIKMFDTAGYSYSVFQEENGKYGYGTGEDHHKDSLIFSDTVSFQCSIELILTKLSSIVTPANGTQQSFITNTSLPDHTIHFSFPSSDHSQTISIYDILGREVKRIEIPSGVSEYRLQRDGFMSGYYFARLGSQSAKFFIGQ